MQYLTDSQGLANAIVIPIKEWEKIQKKLGGDALPPIPSWQKRELDARLKEAKEKRDSLLDFDKAMQELENEL